MKTQQCAVCIFELRVTQKYKDPEYCTTVLLWCIGYMLSAGISIVRSLCEVTNIFVGFQPNFDFFFIIFVEVPNIKFYGNPSSGSRAGACGRTDRRTMLSLLKEQLRDGAATDKVSGLHLSFH